MQQLISASNNKALLEKANRLINDDVPTMVQMFTNPLDEVFDKPYEKNL